jgi:hypothetical protein
VSIIVYYCFITQCQRVRSKSPRVPAWCWRRIPVDRSARGVNDSDAFCSGSASHSTLVRCRQCMSMAMREPRTKLSRAMDALETHRLRGIYLCRSPVSSTRCRHKDTRGGVHYAVQVQVQAPSQLLCNYGGLPRFTPSNYKLCNTQKRVDKCKKSQCMVSYNSFAIQVRLNHDCWRQWQRHVEIKN